jgi:hypothetical protein
MMLVSFRIRSNNYCSAYFCSLLFFLANKSISVLDVVHMAFEFRVTDFEGHIFAKVLLIIIHIHSATLKKQPQLSSTFVLQMIVLTEFFVKVEHTRREELFVDSLNVFKVELELAIQFSFFYGRCTYTADCLVHEWLELVFEIIFEKLLSMCSGFEDFLFKVVHVQVIDNIGRG